MDAVTWIHWTSVSGTATPSCQRHEPDGCAADLHLRGPGLHAPGAPDYTTPNWACYGGSAAPIAIYMAQSGSGTESTWAGLLGLTVDRLPLRRRGPEPRHLRERDVVDPGQQGPGQRHLLLLVRQVPDHLRSRPALLLGCFDQQDRAWSDRRRSRSARRTIAAQLPGSTGTPFPGDRLLFNVYSDGSNPDIPISSPASLNAVSEDGFLCKPSSARTLTPTPVRPTGPRSTASSRHRASSRCR